MNQIVLERRKDPPIEIAELHTTLLSPEWWCLKIYRVRHVASMLSADGRTVTCFFEARDAETMRSLLRRVREPYERLWPATVHAPPSVPAASALAPHGPTLVIVERDFAEPADFDALQATEDRAAWCLEEHRVRFLRTWFATDRRRMLCLYAAPDAESVRLAQQKAGMPFTRVWAARLHEPA